uniref:(northern house mosquito) hypothetical protein n=1 Tax=Culex pipiens TaxID=7175 RepID=A0A8D8FKF7_CULPI
MCASGWFLSWESYRWNSSFHRLKNVDTWPTSCAPSAHSPSTCSTAADTGTSRTRIVRPRSGGSAPGAESRPGSVPSAAAARPSGTGWTSRAPGSADTGTTPG